MCLLKVHNAAPDWENSPIAVVVNSYLTFPTRGRQLSPMAASVFFPTAARQRPAAGEVFGQRKGFTPRSHIFRHPDI